MAATRQFDKIWEEAIVTVRGNNQLSEKHQQLLHEVQNREVCSLKLKASWEKFGQRRTTRNMQAIQPALDHIESFSKTIGIFVSSHPEVAALIWGSFYLMIQINSRLTTILGTAIDMVEGMMKLMPRLESYNEMYGKHPNFAKALSELFVGYATFAIRTHVFLRKSIIRIIFGLLCGSFQIDYENAKKRFDRSAREVEAEAEAIHKRSGFDCHNMLEEIYKQMPRLSVKASIPCHLIKVNQNDRYFARVDVTQKLKDNLLPQQVPKNQDRLRSFSIRGMGGMGKSQVAIDFAWSYRSCYDVIIWLHAENKAVLADDFSAAGEKLLAPQIPDQAKTIDMLRDWLADTGNIYQAPSSKYRLIIADHTWLLVFDNVEERRVLERFWPKSAHGSILITTRHADIAEMATEQYWLQPLTQDDGKGYLQSLLKTMSAGHLDKAEEVTEELGGMPLALSQAAAYMKKSLCSCGQFLDIYRQRHNASDINRKNRDLVHQDYKFQLDTVFCISVDQLSLNANQLLSLLAFFDPDWIDESLLKRGAAQYKDLLFLTDLHLRRSVLTELSDLSLVRLQDGPPPDNDCIFVSMHRLLQRDRLYYLDTKPQVRQRQFDQACSIIRQGFPRQDLGQPMTRQWPICKKTLPHIVRLHSVFKESQDINGTITFAELLSDVGFYLWEMGQLKEAIDHLQTSRKICETVLDEYSLVKADVLNIIGAIHIEAGFPQLHEGLKMMDQVLKIRKNRLQAAITADERRDRTVEVSNALNNLGNAYMGLREWDTADQMITECIDMLKGCANEHDRMYEFAERYANLGRIRAQQNRFDEAEDLCRKAVALNGKAHGSEDLRSCLFRFYLAVVLMQSGKLQESFAEHIDLLRVRKTNLGSTHHDVGDSYYAVGFLQHLMGHHAEAAQTLERALEVFEHVFWSEDRRARTSFLLSVIYGKLQRHGDSQKMKDQAEELRSAMGDVVGNREDTLEAYDVLVFYVHG